MPTVGVLEVSGIAEECLQTLFCTGDNCCIVTKQQTAKDGN